MWLKERHINFKIFHLSTIIRRRKNKIGAIPEGKNWLVKETEIASYFRNNFAELFKFDYFQLLSDFEDLIPHCINEEKNGALKRILLEEEIKESVWSLHSLKSLRLDGFPSICFNKYWSTIKDKVINFVQKCFKLKNIFQCQHIISCSYFKD